MSREETRRDPTDSACKRVFILHMCVRTYHVSCSMSNQSINGVYGKRAYLRHSLAAPTTRKNNEPLTCHPLFELPGRVSTLGLCVGVISWQTTASIDDSRPQRIHSSSVQQCAYTTAVHRMWRDHRVIIASIAFDFRLRCGEFKNKIGP